MTDIAIGVNQDSINSASSNIYAKVHSKFFTGSSKLSYLGTSWDVQWDIQTPPSFNLSRKNLEANLNVFNAYIARSVENYNSINSIKIDIATARNLALNSANNFIIIVEKTVINLSGGGKSLNETISASVMCTVSSDNNGNICFIANDITMTSTDPIFQWFLDKKIKSEVLVSVQNLLLGLKIPPIQFSSLKFGNNTAGIINNCIVNVASLGTGSIATLPDSFSAPNGFSLNISDKVVQSFVSNWWVSLPKELRPDKDVQIHVNNYNFALSNNSAIINISLNGDVYVSMGALGEAHWTISISPINILANLSINGSNLNLNVTNVSNPSVNTSPANFGAGIISIGLPVDAIVNSAVQSQIGSTIRSALNATIYTIPIFQESVQGFNFTITPTNLSVTTSPEAVVVSGNLSIN